MESLDKKPVLENEPDSDSIKLEQSAATLNEILRESGIDTHVELVLFLGAHSDGRDAELLKESLERCDIFIPELVGWDENSAKAIEDISSGARKRKDISSKELGVQSWHPFYSNLLRNIENTGKTILLVDTPKDHHLTEEMTQHYRDSKNLEIDSVADTKLAAKKYAEFWKGYQDIQMKREEYILQQLPVEIPKLFEKHPELKNRENLNILMFMGALHGGLRPGLSEIIENTSTKLSVPKMVYGFTHELMKRHQYKKEISSSLELHVLFERLLMKYCTPVYGQMMEKNAFFRKIASKFSDDEISVIWSGIVGKDADEAERIVSRELVLKSIYIPNSEEEFRNFIET